MPTPCVVFRRSRSGGTAGVETKRFLCGSSQLGSPGTVRVRSWTARPASVAVWSWTGCARGMGMARHELHSSELRTVNSQDGGGSAVPVTAEIRILLVEDVAVEAELTLRQLRTNGIRFVAHRVDTESAMRDALREFQPAIVLSDFTLPRFDGLSALKVASELAPEVPFIFVSGTIGEERAVEALRRGAADYVLKTNLTRLAPAVNRALAEAAARGQIARLTRVLRMLSGINSAVVRIRDRIELLNEACRLAVAIGGYATAMVLLKEPGERSVQPVAWSDPDDRTTATLRTT